MAEPVVPQTPSLEEQPQPTTPPEITQTRFKATLVRKARAKKKKPSRETPTPPPLPPPPVQGEGGDPQAGANEPLDDPSESLTKIAEELLRKRLSIGKGERPPPIESAVLNVASETIPRFVAGKPTAQIKDRVSKVAGSVEDKYKILGSIVESHTMERYLLHARMRWDLEQSIFRNLVADELDPMTKVALYKMVLSETSLMEKIIRQGANPTQDLQGLAEKIDAVQKQTPGDLARRLEGTTPQGREIARRVVAQAQQLSRKLSSTLDRTGG
jgi:hypothetical protein